MSPSLFTISDLNNLLSRFPLCFLLSFDLREDSYDSEGFDFDFEQYNATFMYHIGIRGPHLCVRESYLYPCRFSSKNVQTSGKGPGQCLNYNLWSLYGEWSKSETEKRAKVCRYAFRPSFMFNMPIHIFNSILIHAL